MLYGRNDRIRTCDILLPKQARYHLRYIPIIYFLLSRQMSAALPVATNALTTLVTLSRHSLSCRHFFFLASSATGGARKRPHLRYIPKITPLLYQNAHGLSSILKNLSLKAGCNTFILQPASVFINYSEHYPRALLPQPSFPLPACFPRRFHVSSALRSPRSPLQCSYHAPLPP